MSTLGLKALALPGTFLDSESGFFGNMGSGGANESSFSGKMGISKAASVSGFSGNLLLLFAPPPPGGGRRLTRRRGGLVVGVVGQAIEVPRDLIEIRLRSHLLQAMREVVAAHLLAQLLRYLGALFQDELLAYLLALRCQRLFHRRVLRL